MELARILTIIGASAFGFVIFVLAIITVYKGLYKRVGPNEVLVISGGRGETITDDMGERRRIGVLSNGPFWVVDATQSGEPRLKRWLSG